MSSSFAVGGLASGLDTASIISQLMALERRPLTLMQSKQSAHNSKIAAIQSVNDLISSLQTAAKALTDRSRMNAKSAVTDTPTTSPAVLTATATADAINTSFKVTVNQLATSTRMTSAGPVGSVIDKDVPLADAGFRYVVNTGTFRINGKAIAVDENTTLSSLIDAINNAGAGVTASLVADADGRPENRVQLIAAPGQSIQLGSLSDTSNALRLLNLSDAVITGGAAASTNSGVAADAGALNTSVTINGVVTSINQGDAGFTSAQNAAFIAQAINDNAANTVTALAKDDGTITLTHKTTGSQSTITASGAGSGLNAAGVQNGTDQRVVSSTNLGVTNVGASLTNARLATPIAGLVDGSGTFKINDVEISYKDTDSITTIVNRINASSAGVSAFYDPVQDRLRLSASQTGARAMTLEDTQGNFLAATGLLNGTEQLGQNAVFSIDAVNGGAPLTSATNTVTGYVPGVTLTLKSASESPVTVTVAQDSAATINAVKGFVNQYNAVLQKLEDLTRYNSTTKRASTLTGDSGIRDIQRRLRQLVSGSALGATGQYRSLASIGVSFGAAGSGVGTTSKLVVDDAKLTKAITENPQAVESVLAGFAATTGTPTGAVLTGVSGTPQVHQDGTYQIKITSLINGTQGSYEAKFVSSSGQTLWTGTGIMAPGQENLTVIPGLKVTAPAVLEIGAEDSFTVSVSNRGVGVTLNDYLTNLTSREGYFADRKAGDDRISKDFTDRLAIMQDRLDRRQASLEKKYAALEVAMARMQSQGNALSAQLAQLSGSSVPA